MIIPVPAACSAASYPLLTGGGGQGNRYLPGAVPVAPPPPAASRGYPVAEQAMAGDGMIMAGQTTSSVAVQVDFALVPK